MLFLVPDGMPPVSAGAAAAVGEVVSPAVLLFVLYRQRQARALQTRPVFPLVLVVLGLDVTVTRRRLILQRHFVTVRCCSRGRGAAAAW